MSARDGVLLIGGNGFLGRALARALAAAGHEVHVLSRHVEPGRREGIVFHRGSQSDAAIVAPLLARCGTVFHLASTTTPGSSARMPLADTEQNLLPAAHLIETMTTCPPDRLIFISTGGAIYGNPASLPVDESLAPHPLSYHAAGKVALEALFTAYAHAHDVPLTILRPSNIYGPGQPLHGGFGLIRTLLEKALRGASFEIWGDGSAVRDYLFIDDCVSACIRLIDSPTATGTYNAGSGVGTSIRELIALVEHVTGCELRLNTRAARATDVREIILDSSRLITLTGWTPKITLEKGLAETWTWIRETAR